MANNPYANEWGGNAQPISEVSNAPSQAASYAQAAPPIDPTYFQNMAPEQLQALESSGRLSPEIVSQIRAMQGQGQPSPTQVSNLEMQTAAPEAAALVSQSMLPEAGLQPPSMPTPMAPLSIPSPQAAALAPAVEQQAADQALAQAAAESGAQKARVLAEADMQAQADKAAAKAVEKDQLLTAQVDKDLGEVPSLGSQIGQAIAIMLGGASQGLTGAKENPALVAIEKQLNREAEKRKYSQEQKDKLFEQAYKKASLALEEKKANATSMYQLKQISLAERELGLKMQEAQAKAAKMSTAGATTFTDAERAQIPNDPDGRALQAQLVRLPNGTWAKGIDDKDAGQLRNEYLPGIGKAIKGLKTLTDLSAKTSPLYALDFTAKKQAAEAVRTVIGAMKTEWFGTGTFSDTEQQLAAKIVSNPTEFFSLNDANKAQFLNMIAKLKDARRDRLRESGIDLPLTPNERTVQAFMQANPNITKAEALNAIPKLVQTGRIKPSNWDFNEE